jgi:hypothetical protein
VEQEQINRKISALERDGYSEFDSDDFAFPEGLKRIHFKQTGPFVINENTTDSIAEGIYEK